MVYGSTGRARLTDEVNRGAEMRLKFDHHNAHRWNHRLWVACRAGPLKRFLRDDTVDQILQHILGKQSPP